MRVDIKSDPESGWWLAAPAGDGPKISAHADRNRSADDPVTIFWGGSVDAARLEGFFTEAAPAVDREEEPAFKTVVFTDGAPEEFKSRGRPEFPYFVKSQARFVRLERSAGGLAEDADFIVWARLNEDPIRSNDSIGVYLRPSQIQSMMKVLAQFISETEAKQLTPDQVAAILIKLDQKLPKLR